MATLRRTKPPPLIDKHDPAFLVRPFEQQARKINAQFTSDIHRAWIATKPCRACGRTHHVAAAHLRKGSGAGTGDRPHDFLCNPLCDGYLADWAFRGCHNTQHDVGEVTFWSPFGGIEIAREEALALALKSPCTRTRKAVAEFIAGRDWRNAA